MTDELSQMQVTRWLNLAKKAGVVAANQLNACRLAWLNDSGVEKKHAKDVKIQADVASETILVNAFEPTGLAILSEENYRQQPKQKCYWVLDPLDGTANYVRGLPCAVSIALMCGDVAVLGVIVSVFTGDVYAGSIHHKASKNDQPIVTGYAQHKSEACLMTGPGNYQQLHAMANAFQDYQMVRVVGSAALSCAYVAEGVADCYIETQRCIWDIAAGLAIIKAGGGDCFLTPLGNHQFDCCLGSAALMGNHPHKI